MEMERSKLTKEEANGDYNKTCTEGQDARARGSSTTTTADLGHHHRRVLRLELQDIGRILEFTCKYCLKSVQLVKLRDHQLAEHREELELENEGVNSSDSPPSSSPPTPTSSKERKRFNCRICPKSFIMESQCRSHENTHPTDPTPSTKDIQANGKTCDTAEGGEEVTMTVGGNPLNPVIENNQDNGNGAEEVRKCKTCQKVLPAPLLLAHIYTHCTRTPGPGPDADKEGKGCLSCSLCQFNTRSCSHLKDHMAVMHYRIKRHICLNCKKARFGWHSVLIKHSRCCTGPPELPTPMPVQVEKRNQQPPQEFTLMLRETTPGASRKRPTAPTSSHSSPEAEFPDDESEAHNDAGELLSSSERAEMSAENMIRKKKNLHSKTSKELPIRPRGQKSRVNVDGQTLPAKASPVFVSEKPVAESDEYYACETCPRRIRTSLFVEHLVTHCTHSSGKFKCNMCEYTGKQSRDLKDHLTSVHYGIKRHVCPRCNASFGWYTTLSHHFHLCGQPDPLRPFKCDHCPKRFLSSEKLAAHSQYHSVPGGDGQLLTCKMCRKCFFETPAFIQHLDVHVKNAPVLKFGPGRLYSCPMSCCTHKEWGFARLRGHLAYNHHEVNPYVCSACGTTFKSVGALSNHIKLKCRRRAS